MNSGTIQIMVNVGGVVMQKTITRTADHANIYGDGRADIPIAAGTPVATWTKSDIDTGTATLTEGHGLSSGTFDVFWDGGVKYGATGLLTVNSLALDGGTGDDYPTTGEAGMVVCKAQVINTEIDGDAVAMIAISASRRALLRFYDINSALVGDPIELAADEPWVWWADGVFSNPLTGNPIRSAKLSSGSITAGVFSIQSLEDSTP